MMIDYCLRLLRCARYDIHQSGFEKDYMYCLPFGFFGSICGRPRRGRGVEESPIRAIAILLIIKTGSGPIYKHSTRSTIKQYIVNVEKDSFLAKAKELFWVPASGANTEKLGGITRQNIKRAKADGYGR
jgi:hypothetical protein